MPRANRYLLPGQILHLTHRCHNRQFWFKFHRDRRIYRWWLWEALRRHPVSLLAYALTSNHVHEETLAGAAPAWPIRDEDEPSGSRQSAP